MTIFRNVVFLAAITGLVAGLTLAALQSFTTIPLILAAEEYEGMPATPDAASGNAGAAASAGHNMAAMQNEAAADEGWSPSDGFERTAYTVAANVVGGIGIALLLIVASEAAGGLTSWRRGLFWGLAGFAAFTLAPGLELQPNMPGMPAAEILGRQAWWIATGVSTAVGIWLIFARSTALAVLAGIALIVAPHVVGAPQPESFDTAVPDAMHIRFIAAVTMANLVFWVVLGAVAGALRNRFLGPDPVPARPGFA